MYKYYTNHLILLLALLAPISVSAKLRVHLNFNSHDEKVAKCKEGLNGIQQNDRLHLESHVSGAKGRVEMTFFWNLENYQLPNKWRNQKQHEDKVIRRLRDGQDKFVQNFSFRAYPLKDDIDYVQQVVNVIVKDSTGETAHDSIMFNVSRPFILKNVPNHPLDCFQIYPANLKSGIICNDTTNDQRIDLTQGNEDAYSSMVQKSKGWNIYPSIFYNGLAIALFSFYKSYLDAKSRRIAHNVFMNINYTLSPGECIGIYEQMTRFKTAFDVYHVNECGNHERVGTVHHQSWSKQNPVSVIDPAQPDPFSNVFPGLEARNTCDDIDEEGNQFLPDAQI